MKRTLYPCPLGCARSRHYEGHPHLEGSNTIEEERTSGNVSVVGADSPEALAAQIAQETAKKNVVPMRSRAEVEEAERRARIEAMRPLARQLAVIPYSAVSIATFDPRWRARLRDDSINALEAATLNTMLAWGIEFSGKWSSVAALAMCHAETMGNLWHDIAAEDKAKKAAAAARNAVTQNTTQGEQR